MAQVTAKPRPDADTLVESNPGHGVAPVSPAQTRAILPLLAGLLLLIYCVMLVRNLSFGWFNPDVYTDDSYQQIFPFYEVLTPGIFKGDLPYEAMKGYLPPLHYGIGAAITLLTRDPIMTGHWMMLLQILLTAGFLFAAVRSKSAVAPALFAVVWFLHTRHVIQRMTQGLPRGWAAPVLAAFAWLVLTKQHRAILALIIVGCFLHPPSTMIVCVAYGMLVVWECLFGTNKLQAKRKLIELALLAPVAVLLVLAIVKRPPEIGDMVSLTEAESMPSFDRAGGRFPFLPFTPWPEEIARFGFQSILTNFYEPPEGVRDAAPFIILAGLVSLVAVGMFRNRGRKLVTAAAYPIPRELGFLGLAILTVYFLSRQFAFRLYVPDRHLQFPLAIFFIVTFSIGIWRAFHRETDPNSISNEDFRSAGFSTVGFLFLASFIWLCSRDGLQGTANFNSSRAEDGPVFSWVRSHTPTAALIAGHPTFIDATQLLAVRRAYATTETAHPFYREYFDEMMRRLRNTFRGYYAHDAESFLAAFEPDGVDYVIVKRDHFRRTGIMPKFYFKPLGDEVKELTKNLPGRYFLRRVARKVAAGRVDFVPYQDQETFVVDVAKLRQHQRQTDHAHPSKP